MRIAHRACLDRTLGQQRLTFILEGLIHTQNELSSHEGTIRMDEDGYCTRTIKFRSVGMAVSGTVPEYLYITFGLARIKEDSDPTCGSASCVSAY